MLARLRLAKAAAPHAAPAFVCVCLLALLLAAPATAHHTPTEALVTPTWDDWSSRAVYQLLSGRFAAP